MKLIRGTPTITADPRVLADEIYKPFHNYETHKGYSVDPEINPNYIKPRMLLFRLNKIMDEYGGGCGTNYITSNMMINKAMELLDMLKEDSANMAAKDLHELMRCWENYHRIWTAEAHLRHIAFREESRYPGFYYRSDFDLIDDTNWKCFVNSKMDPKTGQWSAFKKAHKDLVSK